MFYLFCFLKDSSYDFWPLFFDIFVRVPCLLGCIGLLFFSFYLLCGGREGVRYLVAQTTKESCGIGMRYVP